MSTTASSAGHSRLSARAQFSAFARAVNLQPSALPGFHAEREVKHSHVHFNADLKGAEPAFRHCAATGKEPKPTLEAKSAKLKSASGTSSEQFSSDVEVEPTVAVARREFAAASRLAADPKARRCITRLLTKVFDAGGTGTIPARRGPVKFGFTIGGVRISPIVLPQQAVDAVGVSFVMNVSYTFTVRGRTIRLPRPLTIQMDQLAFRMGRAGVSLHAMAVGRECSPEREASLYLRLLSRARIAGSRYPAVRSSSHLAAKA